jgi:hypothetical protein
MNNQATNHHPLVTLVLLALPFAAAAQVPVDDDGNAVGTYETAPDNSVAGQATGNEDIPLLGAAELEELVGPIALYPDDLLAIVLPAAAYPMQLIEAERFLEKLEEDPSLEPGSEWNDAVVALLNYPEVVALLNEDIDWTWRLGEAVVAQQTDVVGAIESFRDRAYAAGNLKSDDYQTVSRDGGVIEITPVSEDVIYVPYYEPERVVVYQPRPVYYYYPRAYPVYYYPYPSSYHFDRGYFWGVTTAFTIGWLSDSLHVYHHSYYGHPYYGRSYWNNWWYRQPSINVYNTTYVRNSRVTVNRYYTGDRWTPRHDRRRPVRPTQPRVMNRDYYARDRDLNSQRTRSVKTREPIQFRERTSSRDGVRTGSRKTLQPGNRSEGRPTRDSIARELRKSRERSASQRREPATRAVTRRQPPVASADRGRPQPVTRSGSERSAREPGMLNRKIQPTVRQRTERREPVARQEQPTRNTRATPRAQPRAQAQARQAPRSQSRSEARPTPRPQPQRQSRPAPRRDAQPANTRRSSSKEARPEPKKRSKERRSARR